MSLSALLPTVRPRRRGDGRAGGRRRHGAGREALRRDGCFEVTAFPGWKSVAGVTGLVLAAVASCAAFGFEMEDAERKTVLPLLRRRPACTSLHGDVTDQLDGVAHEAGVREQL